MQRNRKKYIIHYQGEKRSVETYPEMTDNEIRGTLTVIINIINIFQDIKKIRDIVIEMKDTKKIQREILEVKNTIPKMKNTWNEIKSQLDTANETVNKTKRQPSEWEKIFANESTDKGLISKIYKQLMELNIKNKTIQFKKMAGRPK